MKYNDNGVWKDLVVKSLDSMPVGSIVEYDGQVSDIPTGWEKVSGQSKIKKTSETTPIQASVVDGYSTSTQDGYSCNYVNECNSYSTSETLTNKKWQGLPVYRKVINLSSAIECTENSWVSVLNVSSYNINQLIKVIAISTNNCVWNGFLTRISNNQLQFFNGITGWNVSVLVLEYTKTS